MPIVATSFGQQPYSVAVLTDESPGWRSTYSDEEPGHKFPECVEAKVVLNPPWAKIDPASFLTYPTVTALNRKWNADGWTTDSHRQMGQEYAFFSIRARSGGN